MKVLLDTNIVIHREASIIEKEEIGELFRWLDKLHYTKCIHPLTVKEIEKHSDQQVVRSMSIKLGSYDILKTEPPMDEILAKISKNIDTTQNDFNDSKLLNELINGRIDFLITEDRKIHSKASMIGVSEKVFTIDSFLEKIISENPEQIDYKVLSIRKMLFGNVDIRDTFFDGFKEDYKRFEKWFNGKSNEPVYVCNSKDGDVIAFLYLKKEDETENYSDITPAFPKKKRLKIGTFKVTLNGFKLGERLMKIIFDNALQFKVEEIYVTVFNKREEQLRLIGLLEDWGFERWGVKSGPDGEELVYVRNFARLANKEIPKLSYPYISGRGNAFIVPIRPEYHTNLLPDSILKTESPAEFVENESFRNAISKVYISRSYERDLKPGDLIVFYRTSGGEWPARYKSVVTTLGVVENAITKINDEKQFLELCRKRSVFSDKELAYWWNYNIKDRPFIVNFLFLVSFPKRITLDRLIELGIIDGIDSAPRGFERINFDKLHKILKEAQVDESIIVD